MSVDTQQQQQQTGAPKAKMSSFPERTARTHVNAVASGPSGPTTICRPLCHSKVDGKGCERLPRLLVDSLVLTPARAAALPRMSYTLCCQGAHLHAIELRSSRMQVPASSGRRCCRVKEERGLVVLVCRVEEAIVHQQVLRAEPAATTGDNVSYCDRPFHARFSIRGCVEHKTRSPVAGIMC